MTVANPATSAPRLVRALGPLGLGAAIVNVIVGGGIFRLPAGAAAALGTAAPLAYAACAAAMGLIVLCVAEAGSRVSRTGGLYAYVEVAFGPFVGFVAGVMLYACMAAALGAVSAFLADLLGAIVPALAAGCRGLGRCSRSSPPSQRSTCAGCGQRAGPTACSPQPSSSR